MRKKNPKRVAAGKKIWADRQSASLADDLAHFSQGFNVGVSTMAEIRKMVDDRPIVSYIYVALAGFLSGAMTVGVVSTLWQ